MRSLGLAVAAIVLLGAHAADAARRTLSLVGADVVTSAEGSSRLLLKFPAFDELKDAAIADARLTFPALAQPFAEDLDVCVWLVSRDWTPGTITWTSPWTEPGGDLQEGTYGRRTVVAGESGTVISIDITSLLVDVLAGREGFGVLLSVPESRAQGFTTVETARLAPLLAGAVLEVRYRNQVVPPRLRGR